MIKTSAGKLWVNRPRAAAYSALAAALSAVTAYLTFNANYIIHERIALVAVSLSTFSGKRETHDIRFSLLNQGNKGFLLQSVGLLEMIGSNLTSNSCSIGKFATLETMNHHTNFGSKSSGSPVDNDMNSWLTSFGKLYFLTPQNNSEMAKTTLQWLSGGQAVSATLTFDLEPSILESFYAIMPEKDRHPVVVYCPMIDFVTAAGLPKRAICPGWIVGGTEQASGTSAGEAGPIQSGGYSLIIPKGRWPNYCAVVPATNLHDVD